MVHAGEPLNAEPIANEGVAFNSIDTFLRIKPVPRPTNRIVIDPLDGNVEFSIPRDTAAGFINNSRERYLFKFNGILAPEAKQDEVCGLDTSLLQQLAGGSQSTRDVHPMRAGVRACGPAGDCQHFGWVQWDHICLWTDRLRQNLHHHRRSRTLCG